MNFNGVEFFFQVMFHAEFDATHDPVKRDRILANAFSTVPGAELDSINVEYFLFRDNHGMKYFSSFLRVEQERYASNI